MKLLFSPFDISDFFYFDKYSRGPYDRQWLRMQNGKTAAHLLGIEIGGGQDKPPFEFHSVCAI